MQFKGAQILIRFFEFNWINRISIRAQLPIGVEKGVSLKFHSLKHQKLLLWYQKIDGFTKFWKQSDEPDDLTLPLAQTLQQT